LGLRQHRVRALPEGLGVGRGLEGEAWEVAAICRGARVGGRQRWVEARGCRSARQQHNVSFNQLKSQRQGLDEHCRVLKRGASTPTGPSFPWFPCSLRSWSFPCRGILAPSRPSSARWRRGWVPRMGGGVGLFGLMAWMCRMHTLGFRRRREGVGRFHAVVETGSNL